MYPLGDRNLLISQSFHQNHGFHGFYGFQWAPPKGVPILGYIFLGYPFWRSSVRKLLARAPPWRAPPLGARGKSASHTGASNRRLKPGASNQAPQTGHPKIASGKRPLRGGRGDVFLLQEGNGVHPSGAPSLGHPSGAPFWDKGYPRGMGAVQGIPQLL